jgi:hypothetical protein
MTTRTIGAAGLKWLADPRGGGTLLGVTGKPWHAVRCVFKTLGLSDRHTYEERITLWHVESAEEAIDRAEAEAQEYPAAGGDTYLGLAQSFLLECEPVDGAEVFSLMRYSELDATPYLARFFSTGDERQGEYGK